MKTISIVIISLFFIRCQSEVNSEQVKDDQVHVIKSEMNKTLIKIRNENTKASPLVNIQIVNIDCNKSDSLLANANAKDQDMRKGIDTGIVDVDGENQQTIVSIIENCGWPKSEKGINIIWTVLQHSNLELISHYYFKLKELEKEGLIKPSTMALMEDRLLMLNAYPQIYGSQVVKGKLYKLKDPKNINKLRKSVGLGSIEEYTKHFGIEFKIEDYINK